jgi:hypothetical protein
MAIFQMIRFPLLILSVSFENFPNGLLSPPPDDVAVTLQRSVHTHCVRSAPQLTPGGEQTIPCRTQDSSLCVRPQALYSLLQPPLMSALPRLQFFFGILANLLCDFYVLQTKTPPSICELYTTTLCPVPLYGSPPNPHRPSDPILQKRQPADAGCLFWEDLVELV